MSRLNAIGGIEQSRPSGQPDVPVLARINLHIDTRTAQKHADPLTDSRPYFKRARLASLGVQVGDILFSIDSAPEERGSVLNAIGGTAAGYSGGPEVLAALNGLAKIRGNNLADLRDRIYAGILPALRSEAAANEYTNRTIGTYIMRNLTIMALAPRPHEVAEQGSDKMSTQAHEYTGALAGSTQTVADRTKPARVGQLMYAEVPPPNISAVTGWTDMGSSTHQRNGRVTLRLTVRESNEFFDRYKREQLMYYRMPDVFERIYNIAASSIGGSAWLVHHMVAKKALMDGLVMLNRLLKQRIVLFASQHVDVAGTADASPEEGGSFPAVSFTGDMDDITRYSDASMSSNAHAKDIYRPFYRSPTGGHVASLGAGVSVKSLTHPDVITAVLGCMLDVIPAPAEGWIHKYKQDPVLSEYYGALKASIVKGCNLAGNAVHDAPYELGAYMKGGQVSSHARGSNGTFNTGTLLGRLANAQHMLSDAATKAIFQMVEDEHRSLVGPCVGESDGLGRVWVAKSS